jgi:hypothetical protein
MPRGPYFVLEHDLHLLNLSLNDTTMTSTSTRYYSPPYFFAAVFSVFVILPMLLSNVMRMIELHHVELTSCTILDAQAVAKDGTWAIHVNYTIPSTFHLPPNSTITSVLDGTNSFDHYFVNQTFPCYASTRHLHSVVLDPSVGVWDIVGIIGLSVAFSFSMIMMHISSKSVSVGGGSGDIESGMRVSLDSHMTAVESDLVVEDEKENHLTGGE